MRKATLLQTILAAAALTLAAGPSFAEDGSPDTTRGQNGAPYEEGEIVGLVSDFFQMTTKDAGKAVETVFSASDSSGKLSVYFLVKFWCEARLSALTPSTTIPLFCMSWLASRKEHASLTHPGVSSLG